ncbi:lytic transglycosylase domain-containing protein [Alicyclobacillus fastidiosus]|uniref:Lytic transglycosylase domain-containing protein n=1 Tax=Alicyclobacillus fastidiosus TaxID=392011 RepID=A0ABV5ABJ2_9BACL|nr:lytic transglycosylase domain-containing protein [Alicyclobacillus fastidiosus]WEH10446.1 lytic transglycosylase domain-containing protein [Alicyclobacillus fastidiosus]
MDNHSQPGKRRTRFIVLKGRPLLAAVLLIVVLVVISTNSFWRMMYPIEYQSNIQSAASFAKVDPLLIASVIRVESKFDTQDVSHAGAVGLMQLMPDTAEWIADTIRQQTTGSGGAVNRLPKDDKQLASPQYNILIGSWYVQSLIQQFHGNVTAGIAAYNAGPKRVQGWLSTGTWDGKLEDINQIPVGETRHFVDRVFYNYSLYKKIYGRDPQWQVRP